MPGPPTDRPLFRFSLFGFMLFVAGISVLVAVVNHVPGYAKVAVVVAVLVVTAHVVASLIGGRLHANAEQRRRWYKSQGLLDPDQHKFRHQPIPLQELDLPRGCHLGTETGRLAWLPLLLTLGGCLGAAIGGIGISATIGHRITIAGLVVGMISTGAMGAWLAFLASGFITISRHAWREAMAQEQQDAMSRSRNIS